MFLRHQWLWLVLPLLLCVGLAITIHDVRWAIVGLMILFIVIPMLLALAYFNYALSMEARWSLLEKAITVREDGLLLQFTDERMHDHLIRWDEVSGIAVGGECFLMMLKVRRYTFVMIPFSVVEDAQLPIQQFASLLGKHIIKKSDT